MNTLNTKFCSIFAGTFGSTGLGSAVNFCPETAPASINVSINLYTGSSIFKPNDVTKWL